MACKRRFPKPRLHRHLGMWWATISGRCYAFRGEPAELHRAMFGGNNV